MNDPSAAAAPREQASKKQNESFASPPTRRLTSLWLVALAIPMVAWVYASPLGSSPDEPAHFAYAWGLMTGQNVFDTGECINTQLTCKATRVETPAGLVPDAGCHAFRREVPASCIQPRDSTSAVTNMVRYPPPYYVITGTALRVGHGLGAGPTGTGYLARLASGALLLSLIVPTLTLASNRRPALLPFLLAPLTPMTMFLATSVNPSGSEVAGAIAAAGAVTLAAKAGPDRDVELLFIYGLFWLGLSRPLGVLWAGSLFLFGLLYWGLRPNAASLRYIFETRRLSVAGGGAVVGLSAAWFMFMLGVHSTTGGATSTTLPEPGLERLLAVPLRWGEIVWENLGVLGWLDTPQPRPVMLGLLSVLTLIGATAGFSVGNVVHRRTAVAFVLVIVLGITAVMYRQGFLWQGRYALPPLAAGFVLFGGSADNQYARTGRRLAVLAWLMSASGILWIGARYIYGIQRGSRFVVPNFSDNAQWFGPLGSIGFLAISTLAMVGVPAALWLVKEEPKP